MSRLHAIWPALLLGLIGTGIAHAERPAFSIVDRPSQDGRCVDDQGRGDLDRSEPACLAQIPDVAQRSGATLKVTFRNKRTRLYRNQDAKCAGEATEECVKYQLTGYFPDHDLILLERGRSVGIDWLLVRADNGDEIAIVAPPHYSPERRWLVAVTSRLGPSGPPDGIDVIPAKRDRLVKDWHFRTPDNSKWHYEFERWEGEGELILMAKPIGDTASPRLVALSRKKGEWTFK
ncbi:hypothetical protein ACQR1Y_26590 [Bradyrhizobium sp. HKCCYLRH3099]|uniref:hypothetical protein n=1 Tax=unclassified Bradyrhizobium TaxID=2631580 RepID=UPI003EB81002